MKKIEYYGTLGPACADEIILTEMFKKGMTGLRLNTSHMTINEARPWITMAERAANTAGVTWKFLIDLQGPELRIGHFSTPVYINEGDTIVFGAISDQKDRPAIPDIMFDYIENNQILLLDDSQIKLCVLSVDRSNKIMETTVLYGKKLLPDKSLAIEGVHIPLPALTAHDVSNLKEIVNSDIHLEAVMQPFVRSAADIIEVRKKLNEYGLQATSIMAKIENDRGVCMLRDIIGVSDQIIIARGDLGTDVGLEALPVVQKKIEAVCHEMNCEYMVVTQMLNSMMTSKVPTRAEVSDIAHAVFCGASSLMLTGETAAGQYPVEAIACLITTAENARNYCKKLYDEKNSLHLK